MCCNHSSCSYCVPQGDMLRWRILGVVPLPLKGAQAFKFLLHPLFPARSVWLRVTKFCWAKQWIMWVKPVHVLWRIAPVFLTYILCILMSTLQVRFMSALSFDCENRLPYNLYCVGRDVKHCSLTHSLTLSFYWSNDDDFFIILFAAQLFFI